LPFPNALALFVITNLSAPGVWVHMFYYVRVCLNVYFGASECWDLFVISFFSMQLICIKWSRSVKISFQTIVIRDPSFSTCIYVSVMSSLQFYQTYLGFSTVIYAQCMSKVNDEIY